MEKSKIKYMIAFLLTLAVRLLPFRAPNIEPIMAVQMPFAKRYGAISAFLFGFLSIGIYDVFTSGIGVWTLVTAFAYGFVGIGARWFFKNNTSRKRYALFAVIATILYDAVTGLTLGPLFFGQTFISAIVGQIPFTALHLLGNVSFAVFLSPAIEKWIMKDEIKFIQKLSLSFYENRK
jgi:uncharacterized membrane protein